jgi:hypothetical protein
MGGRILMGRPAKDICDCGAKTLPKGGRCKECMTLYNRIKKQESRERYREEIKALEDRLGVERRIK